MNLFDFLFPKSKSPLRTRLTHKTVEEDLQFHSWNVRVIRKSQRKSLTLEIKKSGPIVVRANLTLPNKKILCFLEQKKSWIEHHLQKLSKLPSQNFFEPNEKGQVLILGGYHQLSSHELSKFDSKKFYNQRSEKYFKAKVKEVAEQMGLEPRQLAIRYMKSRWGSCTSKGKITLNSKILAAPEWIIESVIVHELAHLQHMNHSRHFWSLVAKHSPRHKEADAWLRKFF